MLLELGTKLLPLNKDTRGEASLNTDKGGSIITKHRQGGVKSAQNTNKTPILRRAGFLGISQIPDLRDTPRYTVLYFGKVHYFLIGASLRLGNKT
jgi:hypothetical protein